MSECAVTEHSMAQFADILLDLAEGRTEPAEWLAWWAEHEAAVEAACPRGWFIRLVPRGGGAPDRPLWTEQAVLGSQGGACYVLERLGVPAARSTRYANAYETAFARWERAERAEARRRAAELTPLLDGLAVDFPELARFLRRNRDEIESMRPGASPAELAELSRVVGVPLPAAYRTFLSHARELVVGDTVRLTVDHPFTHTVALPTEGMLCFGEYWLEADGDQVLFDLRDGTPEDPPVLYYAHGRRTVERAAATFREWVESLPRALS